ncbi:MAG: helix-hairpin-helix domain-containing protein [Bacteroidales bacterium]|nr:helix-hairpin-helix domain-containing protein [Bacteroidales bacterium]
MNILRDFISYNKHERRGIVVLIAIIVILIGIRIYVYVQQSSFNDVMSNITIIKTKSPSKTISQPVKLKNKYPNSFFKFDPNTASKNDLKALGFSSRNISTIINYRDKGGNFKSPKDLYGIYGIEKELVDLLINFIEINPIIKFDKTKIDSSTAKIFKEEKPKTSSFSPIEINEADSGAIIQLKGIGVVLTGRIIKYRHMLGGFYAKNQLKEVYGISDELYKSIEPFVRIDSTKISQIPINSSSYKELIRHPYLTPTHVKSILHYRKLMGTFSEFNDLTRNFIITKEEAQKIAPYIYIDN